MTTDFDLIVLGTGNAGMAAAGVAASAGRSVAVVESDLVGGTCPNRGCVPKKILVAATESLDVISRASAHGIDVGPAKLSWSALIGRKREMIAGMPESMASSLARRGIELVRGAARFVDESTVEVGDRRLTATKFVVATGSRPRPLPLPGAEHLLTSDDILSMTELPASVVFVGAGVIGLELGHVLARAGAAVTLLEAADRPLSNFDGRAVEVLVDATRELGIEVRTGVRVERIELAADGGFIVRGQHAGESLSIEAAAVCNGTGRVANVDTLDLPAAGVPVDKYRVELDPQLRSVHNPNILFAGDVVPGTPQLATLATVEGRAAGANALADGDGTAPDYRVVPQAVFTVPTLASVGKRAADASGDHIDVVDTDMASWLSSKSYAEQTAFARIVVDRDADRIVGAHLVGHGAAEVIHTFALAMRYSIPASDLESFVYAYPTFMNDIKYLL